MAAQASNCDYCNSYIPQDYAPNDMNRGSVIKILQHVLWQTSNGEREFNNRKDKMPFVPSGVFTYEETEMDYGAGRKNKHTRKHKKKKHKRHTRYQRGGSGRRKVAQIMTLIVYTSLLYAGLPYVGEAIQKLEALLVSSGLLPKLCGGLEEIAAVLVPGDNVCRLRETSYNRMINGISASLVSLAGTWGYVSGNIWETARRDWNALTNKFENMLEIFEYNKAEDIIGNTENLDIDYSNQTQIDSLENAQNLASHYKRELEEAGLDAEFEMSASSTVDNEPDSQDHWGPSYDGYGEGRHRRHRRRIHPRRSRHRKKKCKTKTRRR